MFEHLGSFVVCLKISSKKFKSVGPRIGPEYSFFSDSGFCFERQPQTRSLAEGFILDLRAEIAPIDFSSLVFVSPQA